MPELLEAQAAGVTADQLTALAKAKPGKSIAYLSATAIGKLRDKAAQPTASEPVQRVDAEALARQEECRQIEDKLIELRHFRNNETLTQEEYAEKVAPLLRRARELTTQEAAA